VCGRGYVPWGPTGGFAASSIGLERFEHRDILRAEAVASCPVDYLVQIGPRGQEFALFPGFVGKGVKGLAVWAEDRNIDPVVAGLSDALEPVEALGIFLADTIDDALDGVLCRFNNVGHATSSCAGEPGKGKAKAGQLGPGDDLGAGAAPAHLVIVKVRAVSEIKKPWHLFPILSWSSGRPCPQEDHAAAPSASIYCRAESDNQVVKRRRRGLGRWFGPGTPRRESLRLARRLNEGIRLMELTMEAVSD